MKGIGYDGILFSTLNVAAGIEPYGAGPSRRPLSIDRRAGTPIHAGVTQGARSFVVTFVPKTGYSTESTLLNLLGHLDPDNSDERTFSAELIDGTDVQCSAAVVTYRWTNVNQLVVEFSASNPVWRKTTPTVLSLTGLTTTTQVALANDGAARAFPLYKVGYSANRSSGETAAIGWKYKREVTITNNTSRDWRDEPVCVDLGDTSAWVTGGKAQSDGDDLRIIYQGQNIYRTLVNWNRERTMVHFPVSINAGASATYDIIYGNPSATTAVDMSSKAGTRATYIAYDIEGDTGTAESGGASTLTDSDRAWETDRWVGGYIMITSGTGALQRRRIASNTATQITVTRAWTTNPAAGSNYAIWRSGIAVDGGAVSAKSANTMTDGSQAWITNQWAGATVTFGGGTTASPTTMTVASNTATQLTFTSSFSTQPTVGDTYRIERFGHWQYLVDTAVTGSVHRGLYRANKYANPPTRLWYGDQTPAGWQPTTYLANGDDYRALRAFSTGGSYWPILRATRRVRQERRMKDEGNGDGMSVYSAFGFQTASFDFQVQNENGIGKVVLAGMDDGGEDWSDIYQYTTTQATLTSIARQDVDLSAYDNPIRLFLGVLPADSDENGNIPNTADPDDVVEVRTDDVLDLWLDLDSFGGLSSSIYSAGSEVGVYDLSAVLRVGGGSTPDTPYDAITIGGTGHKVFLESGEKLWIRTEPATDQPLAAVYDSSDVLQYRAPWAIRARSYREDLDGTATDLVAAAITPVRRFVNLLGTSQDRVTGWTLTNGAGVTATIANASSPDFDGNSQSIRVNVTATPAGAWTIDLDSALIALTPGELYEFHAAFYRSSMAATITGSITANWQTGLATAVVDSPTTATRTLTSATTWYTAGGGLRVATRGGTLVTETDGVIMTLTIAGSGSMTGDVYIDLVTLGPPHLLHISETAQGTLTCETVYTKGWHS